VVRMRQLRLETPHPSPGPAPAPQPRTPTRDQILTPESHAHVTSMALPEAGVNGAGDRWGYRNGYGNRDP
jgi:hypothetical protein